MTGPRSSPPRTSRILVGVALVGLFAVAGVVAGPASAAPPPQELCGVCGDGLERTAEDAGMLLTVEHSTATITADADGTGHWHARVRVTDSAAAALAANATRRERVVGETLDRRTVVEDRTNLSTRVVNDSLVVTFDARLHVTERLGVSLVAFAPAEPGEGSPTVVADRVTVRGPQGTVPTRAPTDASVANESVVWASGGSPGTGPVLAFAGSDGPVGRLSTSAATVLDAGTRAGPWTLLVGAVPALVFGVTVWLLRTLNAGSTATTRRVARTVVAVSGLVAAGAWLAVALPAVGTAPFVESLAAGATVYAAVAAGAYVVDRSVHRRRLWWTFCVVVLVGVLAGALSTQATRGVFAAVPVVIFLSLGTLDGNDDRLAPLAFGLLLAAPLLFASQTSVGDVWFDAAVFTVFVAFPWAAVSAACGAALYVAGREGESGDGPAAVAPFSYCRL